MRWEDGLVSPLVLHNALCKSMGSAAINDAVVFLGQPRTAAVDLCLITTAAQKTSNRLFSTLTKPEHVIYTLYSLSLSQLELLWLKMQDLRRLRMPFDNAGIPADLHLKEFNPQAVHEVFFPRQHQPGSQSPHSSGSWRCAASREQHFHPADIRPGTPVVVGQGPFVIAMVDPDAPIPQRPNNAPVRHINLRVLLKNRIFTDLFLIVQSTKRIYCKDQKEVNPDTGRNAFDSTTQFADKVGLGQPQAPTR